MGCFTMRLLSRRGVSQGRCESCLYMYVCSPRS